MIQSFDHIVLLVADIERAITNWQERLGLDLSYRVDLADADLQQAFFTLSDDTFVELISPGSDASPLAGILSERGEGVHVVALTVDDLDATTHAMQKAGVRLVGAGTERVFIHPASANGVLIQLWPASRPHRWREK